MANDERTINPPSGIEAEVCQDIAERQQRGIAKYGTTVAENPLSLKQWLQHAYEETLDKAIYLKRAIAEMDSAQRARQAEHLPKRAVAEMESA